MFCTYQLKKRRKKKSPLSSQRRKSPKLSRKKKKKIRLKKRTKKEVQNEVARAAKAAHDQDIALPRVRVVVDLVRSRESAGRDLVLVPAGGHALDRDQSLGTVERGPVAERKKDLEAVTVDDVVVPVLGTFSITSRLFFKDFPNLLINPFDGSSRKKSPRPTRDRRDRSPKERTKDKDRDKPNKDKEKDKDKEKESKSRDKDKGRDKDKKDREKKEKKRDKKEKKPKSPASKEDSSADEKVYFFDWHWFFEKCLIKSGFPIVRK